MSDLVVAGAGMGGLVAAARARQLGAAVELREKGDRAGGNMLISSGVVWRHRDFADFRAECPHGDEALQQAIWEDLDSATGWLEQLGAPVVARETGNPRTTGTRFDPAGLTAALLEAAGPVRLEDPVVEQPDRPLILATGGFAANRELLRLHVGPYAGEALQRCTRWSTGDGLRLGIEAGGGESAGMDEVFGRAMPDTTVLPKDFVALAQLYARQAEIVGPDGARFTASAWSENDVTQWLARQPGARGTFIVATEGLDERIRRLVAAAEAAGAPVRRRGGSVEVDVVAGISTTLGGLVVDSAGRVAPGVFAVGNDAGGWATGGYASGLAAALVLGLRTAEAALG